jgi:hypothetical protein
MEVIDQTAVQIDQGAGGQFHARFAPRHFGNDVFSDIKAFYGLEEAVEFFFIGSGGEAEEKIDGEVKGNLAVSGEVFFRVAVLDAKFGAGNDISKKFNKFGIGLAKQHPCQCYRFSKNFLTFFLLSMKKKASFISQFTLLDKVKFSDFFNLL